MSDKFVLVLKNFVVRLQWNHRRVYKLLHKTKQQKPVHVINQSMSTITPSPSQLTTWTHFSEDVIFSPHFFAFLLNFLDGQKLLGVKRISVLHFQLPFLIFKYEFWTKRKINSSAVCTLYIYIARLYTSTYHLLTAKRKVKQGDRDWKNDALFCILATKIKTRPYILVSFW